MTVHVLLFVISMVFGYQSSICIVLFKYVACFCVSSRHSSLLSWWWRGFQRKRRKALVFFVTVSFNFVVPVLISALLVFQERVFNVYRHGLDVSCMWLCLCPPHLLLFPLQLQEVQNQICMHKLVANVLSSTYCTCVANLAPWGDCFYLENGIKVHLCNNMLRYH